ncbi:MAG: endonuclease/exonuclease/phosphatase family protein, partial [Caulobacterales bacterium]|nr:endonuclease/exonuclease/phosphatase family protein [Caulobacterales bacterium]
MRLRLVTWNVNSVRLRMEQVARFVDEAAPDVIALQEIKCQTHEFPREAFEAIGLPHLKIAGQKGWHGVATFSKRPFARIEKGEFCGKGDARHIAVTLDGAHALGKPLT